MVIDSWKREALGATFEVGYFTGSWAPPGRLAACALRLQCGVAVRTLPGRIFGCTVLLLNCRSLGNRVGSWRALISDPKILG